MSHSNITSHRLNDMRMRYCSSVYGIPKPEILGYLATETDFGHIFLQIAGDPWYLYLVDSINNLYKLSSNQIECKSNDPTSFLNVFLRHSQNSMDKFELKDYGIKWFISRGNIDEYIP